MCRFNCRQALRAERILCCDPFIIISPVLQLVLREHKWVGAHTKSKTIFMTNWGSRNIYSGAKVKARESVQAPLYSINAHPPPIAEDRLKEGQSSILCMSYMSNKVINPLTWPKNIVALLLNEQTVNHKSSASGREESTGRDELLDERMTGFHLETGSPVYLW